MCTPDECCDQLMDKEFLSYTNMGMRSPGPAAYCVKPTIGEYATDPSIEKNPAYSIRGKIKNNNDGIGPGPAFNTSHLSRYGKHRTPGGVLSGLLPGNKKALMPGPADYCIGSTLAKGGHRMRPDGSQPTKHFGPAPNAYTLPNTLSCRGARLSPRFKLLDKNITPGPGQYDLPSPDLYLPGRYGTGRTIGKRLADRRKASMPGPADYDGNVRLSCCKRGGVSHVCRISFGIRRGDRVPTFGVRADNKYCC